VAPRAGGGGKRRVFFGVYHGFGKKGAKNIGVYHGEEGFSSVFAKVLEF
jgi:hypothetical protein